MRNCYTPTEAHALAERLAGDLEGAYLEARRALQGAHDAFNAGPLALMAGLEAIDETAATDPAGALVRFTERLDGLTRTISGVIEQTRQTRRQEETRLSGHIALAKSDIADLERTHQAFQASLRRGQPDESERAYLAEGQALKARLERFIETLDASQLPPNFDQRVQARATQTNGAPHP